jgi:hypothetical protein
MTTEPQDLPHEAEARESAKAKQTHSSMDSIEDWQHHPVCSFLRSVSLSAHYCCYWGFILGGKR